MKQTEIIKSHLEKTGSISAREAMADYAISSAALARRIMDLKEEGLEIAHVKKKHPMTGRYYTRYTLL